MGFPRCARAHAHARARAPVCLVLLLAFLHERRSRARSNIDSPSVLTLVSHAVHNELSFRDLRTRIHLCEGIQNQNRPLAYIQKHSADSRKRDRTLLPPCGLLRISATGRKRTLIPFRGFDHRADFLRQNFYPIGLV